MPACDSFTLTAQCFDELRQQLGKFTRHDGEIGLEKLIGIFCLTLRFLFQHIEKRQPFDLQLLGQHK